jgi:integrase
VALSGAEHHRKADELLAAAALAMSGPDGRARSVITADPSQMLKRRKPRRDRARALSRAEVEQLLTREDISLRERIFWRMLYETAARSAEVLALEVEDLDLPNRQARVGEVMSYAAEASSAVGAFLVMRYEAWLEEALVLA